jgi:large subunit ribosomal protein L17
MGHRRALRKNLISDLFTHEQVLTTEAKARMLRPAAEDNPAAEVHARRLAAARISRNRTFVDDSGDEVEIDVVQKLFNDIAPRYADRPGGYTRLVKIGKRPGDNADMAVLMLVDES